MRYTFHVLGLPHTRTTAAYNCCAYTQKIIKFCEMMMSLKHTVYLYGTDQNQARCTEFIPCYGKPMRPENYMKGSFDPDHPSWLAMNLSIIAELKLRSSPHDFICITAGRCQQTVADYFPALMSVEIGVGYSGVFAKYRVFESSAWRHVVYGQLAGDASAADGNFYDTVIPNFFNPEDFPYQSSKDPYYLYMGRLTDRKGWRIAQEVCKKLSLRFLVAGPGDFDGYGEYMGIVNGKARAKLLGSARAVFCPSLYLEPFCGVMAEAMLCGTPVISTDWGTFVENNDHGVTGFRCGSFKEFCDAADNVRDLDLGKIRKYAYTRFAMCNVKQQYQRYFDKLYTLWGDGWYAMD